MFNFDFTTDIQAWLNQFWWQINFLLLILIVVLGYLAIKKPIRAVCLTIILLPTYLFRSKISFLPFTFFELCILVTFFGWCFHEHKYIYQRLIAKLNLTALVPIILILLAATISVFIAPSFSTAAGIWKAYFIEPCLLYIVLRNTTQAPKNKEKIILALGISALPIILLAIYQKFTAFGIAQPDWILPSTRRVTSIFTSPNAVGLLLGPITLIYFGWLIQEIKNKKLLITNLLKIGFIILSLIAIYLTRSQGTWLGLAAGGAFLMFFGWNKKLTIALAIIGIITLITVAPLRDKLMPVILFQDLSGQNRLILWQMSKDYLLTSPKNFIFGAGIGGFALFQNQLRNPLKMEPLLYPHNIILNFWLEIGLLGLLGIILFTKNSFCEKFKAIRLEKNWLTLGIMSAIVAIIIHGMIDVPYFKNDLAILFWLIIGL